MLFKWTPNGVLDNNGNDLGEIFQGFIEIDVKPKVERLKMAKQTETKIDENGEVSLDVSIIDQVESAAKIIASCVTKVELKAGDIEIKTIDDLEMFQEGVFVVNEIFAICLGGIKLGKPSKEK